MRPGSARLLNYVFLLLLLLITLAGSAQHPYFKHYIVNKENPGLSINKIFEDRTGFLWIGTNNGLYRYDGFQYLEYPLPSKIGSAVVTAISQDYSGAIWIGLENGAIAYLKDDKLVRFFPEEGNPASAITGFIDDNKGRLWFSTYGEGLYYYENNRMYNINTDDGLSDNFVYTIAMDKNAKLWAGTDRGINICSIDNGKKVVRVIETDDGLPDNIVQVITSDKEGDLWIGMYDQGICKVDPQTLKFTLPPDHFRWTYGSVNDLVPFSNGDIWIGTGTGIVEISTREKWLTRMYNSGNGFVNSKVQDILKDSEGNTWIATNVDGMYAADKQLGFLQNVKGENIDNVYAILAADNGDVWFSNTNGLYRYVPSAPARSQFMKMTDGQVTGRDLIISIYEDFRGFIWLGTFGNGIYRLNPGTGKHQHIREENGLINNNVLSISGKGNEIWFATLGGASKAIIPDRDDILIENIEFNNYNRTHGLGSNYIYKVYIDSKNREWFATDGMGITVYDGKTFTTYNGKDGLRSEVIFSITEDKKGNIWFSTKNAGIYKFDGKTFTNYNLSSGLRDLAIYSISVDESGNLVIVNQQGLDILNPDNGNIVYYGEENGIEQLDSYNNAITNNEFGHIWIGTQQGIIRYNGLEDLHTRNKPKTIINNVMIFLKDLAGDSDNKFSYKDNHLSFDYIGLWFHSPEDVVYQHKLEGYDLDWIISKNRLSSYSSLPSGKYTFKVRSSTNNIFDESDVASYSFEIKPPFWRTAWFILLVVIVSALLLYAIIKIREARVKKVERLEKDKISFQFETLKNQVNPHFLFNSFNTLITIIEEDKEVAMEYVEKLSDFFRNILTYREKEVITIREELVVIKDYYFLQQKRYNENFTMDINVSEQMQDNLIPPLTLQLLVENAIKHNIISKNKPLKVKIYDEGEYLIVENNLQKKKTPVSSTGVGLQNIINRYKLLTRKGVRINEKADYYVVGLPIIKSL